ncbi:mechanosensitive ion channel family protein [Paenibacillus sp. N1-5-1-14]|uniref:mechanosensitive ion channel family protein n=1 Tax=Paenibacillus radicibacter TaxID=2972488 RepID=UPI002158C7DF|nr:mechanosensitive ion channel family protein [Paenibacillus radicibacter]MCR8642994.1 mechanosensitive ion channel family protein [Paenibacillus radicibacter]
MTWLQENAIVKAVVNYFEDPDKMLATVVDIVQIIAIFVAAKIIVKIANKAINKMLTAKQRGPIKIDVRRSNTIFKLANNIITYTVNFIAIMLILSQLGVNLGPILAGAGVLGLAIGFGAQSLVKDVITGFFIIFEDQFAVGDIVQIDQFKGTVEQIGIRVTRVRSWTGEVHIIPNGNIKQVTNFSMHNSVAVVDVAIAYEANVDEAIEVLKSVSQRLYESHDNIVAEPNVLGVQMLGNSEIVLRTTAECKPNTHVEITRVMHAEIKKEFDKHGIEIPYPKTITYLKSEKAAE